MKKPIKPISILGLFLGLILGMIWFWGTPVFSQSVKQKGDKTYLIDQHGESWDITQAATLGFKPQHFQYGIGRNAIKPVDNNALKANGASVQGSARVIGIKNKDESHAYIISKLARHEIANTTIGDEAVTVGY